MSPFPAHAALSLRDRIARAAFPAELPAISSRGWRAALLIGLVTAGTILSLLRTPLHSWNVLWAEDGAVFLSDALNDGPAAILMPYAGYLHLVPRLAILIAVLFPLQIVPAVVTVVAAFITSLVACATFVFLEGRIRAIPVRFGIWIAMLAAPVAGGEVANNLANLHWPLMIAAFCALWARTRTAGLGVAQCAVVVAAVASDPLAIPLLLPVVLLRLALRGRRERIVIWAYLAAAAVQSAISISAALAGQGRATHEIYPTLFELLTFYGYRVAMTGTIGATGAADVHHLLGDASTVLACILVFAVLVAATIRYQDRGLTIATFSLASIGFAATVYTMQWYTLASGGPAALWEGSRYAVVPAGLLLIALLLAADGLAASRRQEWIKRMIALPVLAAIVLVAAVDLRAKEPKADAPAWSSALEEARSGCATGARADHDVVVEVAPPGWSRKTYLPCWAVIDAR